MTSYLKVHIINTLVQIQSTVGNKRKAFHTIIHGFSPHQSVFGKNPNLPNVLNNKLPTLEEIPSTDNLSDMR